MQLLDEQGSSDLVPPGCDGYDPAAQTYQEPGAYCNLLASHRWLVHPLIDVPVSSFARNRIRSSCIKDTIFRIL